MPEYDQSVYDESYYDAVGEITYDVMRPVRKSLRQFYIPLPSDNRSVALFSLNSFANYREWRKHFSVVHAYDINPHIIKMASQYNLSDFIHSQDLSIPFTPPSTTHLCVCYWLFEHLTDKMCISCASNMIRHAPINIIRLTDRDNSEFPHDPTHINGKSISQWHKFLSSMYRRSQWDTLHHEGNIWCFCRPGITNLIQSLKRTVDYQIESAWASLTVPTPL